MKRNLLTINSLTAVATTSLFMLAGCGKTDLPGSNIKSAEKTSFHDVTSKLDAGGNFYLYLGTEQVLGNLSAKVAKWREVLTAAPENPDERAQVGMAFDAINRLIKESGIEDVTGFGMSSIAREEGLYHAKAILHHYPGQGSGFLWNLFGAKPHDLTALDLLPASSALAVFSDLDATLIWSVIQEQINRAASPEAKQFLQELPREFERNTGMRWEEVLNSLGGEYGIVLTLDQAKMVSIPGVSPPIQVPEPALLIAVRVKDDTLFKGIDRALSSQREQMVVVEEADLKMRTLPLPLPVPIELRPSIAIADGYLLLASTDGLIREVLEVKSGKKPGLKSTEEFKRLSQDIPNQGNQFYFASKRLGDTISDVQQRLLASSREVSSAQKQALESLFSSSTSGFMYSVTANTDEGWYTVGNGNQNPVKAALVTIAVVPGIAAAIAIPAFTKTRQAAQRTECINHLRALDSAKQNWALENRKAPADTPTMSDLTPFVRRGASAPSCPSGGSYTLGNMDTKPRCSIRGHTLN